MRRLFADAFYWIALLHAGDQWHQRVIAFTLRLAAHHLYTTDAVLDEFLATYSAREPISGNVPQRPCAVCWLRPR